MVFIVIKKERIRKLNGLYRIRPNTFGKIKILFGLQNIREISSTFGFTC